MEFFLIFTVSLICIILKKIIIKPKQKNIRGKLALVTGGGNGLGKGISMKLAENGCNIIIIDIDIESAKSTSLEISEKFGVKSKAYKVNVSDYKEIEKLKNEIKNDFGEIDILVNNAGLISYAPIFNESSQLIEKMMQVNLNGVIFMTKCFLEEMMERKSGHIVTVASLAGIYHHAYGVTYCASKFGVVGFMLALKEFIRVKKLENQIFLSTIMPDVTATREDVVKSVTENYKILTIDQVAETAVDGILRNQFEISIPENLHIFIRYYQIIPSFLQNFIRDKLRKENELFQVKGIH